MNHSRVCESSDVNRCSIFEALNQEIARASVLCYYMADAIREGWTTSNINNTVGGGDASGERGWKRRRQRLSYYVAGKSGNEFRLSSAAVISADNDQRNDRSV